MTNKDLVEIIRENVTNEAIKDHVKKVEIRDMEKKI
jgi:hypothetical protein